MKLMPAVENQIKEKEERVEPERELLNWTAPSRPFKRRSRDFYITIIAMAAIVGLVLFLVEGFMPVILIISLVFLFYVLSTVEPENVAYQVTTKGLKVAGRRTDWEVMRRFWFTKRFDSELLVIETLVLPGRMELVINPEVKGELEKKLTQYLVHEEVPPSFLDKSTNWFAKKLPKN